MESAPMRTVMALSFFLLTLAACSDVESSLEPVREPVTGKLVVVFEDPDEACGTALAVIDHDWVVVIKPNTTGTFNLGEGDHIVQYEYDGALQRTSKFTIASTCTVRADTLHCAN